MSEDVVSALLADSGSRRKNISKKTSRRSRKKPKCSGTSTKPTEAVVLSEAAPVVPETTDADLRLNEFLQGSRSTELREDDGELAEHWYDPDGHKQYTLQEIADVMGVSRERVRQVEEQALRKLWRYISIMNKREGVTEDEMFQILTKTHHGEDTIYMP